MSIETQLKAIRKTTGMTQQEFATFLEVSLSNIANVENGSREISKTMMKSLIEKCNISADWLLTGKGSMFITGNETLPANAEYGRIPVLSQKVSCGAGVTWESEQNVAGYIDVGELASLAKNYSLYGFTVKGSSMLGVGIKDGDTVIFSSEPITIFEDGNYIFSLDGEVYCKRLEFDPLASSIKIYSVRHADLDKAELLTTIHSTDTSYADRFVIFGKVKIWIHKDY